MVMHLACRKISNHTSLLTKARLIWPFTEGVLFEHNEWAGCGWGNFSLADLVFNKVGWVLEVHFFSSQGVIVSGQSQAPQCVAATTPFPNDRHDLLFDPGGHRDFSASNPNVGAPVNDTFRSTLEMLQIEINNNIYWLIQDPNSVKNISFATCCTCLHKHLAHGCAAWLVWCAINWHWFSIAWKL